MIMPFSSAAFRLLCSYHVSPTLSLHVVHGSVLEFAHKTGAIVNAANEECLGGGGVDGAITEAGGSSLAQDRLALPRVKNEDGYAVRCPTGNAVITGPGEYGDLQTPYVIHAVGPKYFEYEDPQEGHKLLRSAYQHALLRAEENHLTDVAFALLSSGVYRGDCSLETVLKQAVLSIQSYPVTPTTTFNNVYLCAFNHRECTKLKTVCQDILGDPFFSVPPTQEEE